VSSTLLLTRCELLLLAQQLTLSLILLLLPQWELRLSPGRAVSGSLLLLLQVLHLFDACAADTSMCCTALRCAAIYTAALDSHTSDTARRIRCARRIKSGLIAWGMPNRDCRRSTCLMHFDKANCAAVLSLAAAALSKLHSMLC
jgi:hypothetical protein